MIWIISKLSYLIRNYLTVCIYSVFVISACKSNDNSSLVEKKDYYKSGEIRSIGRYNEKGLLEGKYELYFKNGKLSSFYFYKNGVKDGEFEVFTEDGIKYSKGSFNKGKLHGEVIKYWPSGERKSNALYKNDTIIRRVIFYDNGNVKSIEDKEEGVISYFDDNGNLILKRNIGS